MCCDGDRLRHYVPGESRAERKELVDGNDARATGVGERTRVGLVRCGMSIPDLTEMGRIE